MSGILLYLTSKSDRLLNLNIVALQTLHQKGCIGQDFWAEATLKIEKTTKNKNIRLRWLRSGLLCNRSDPQLAMCLIFLIKLLPSIHYTYINSLCRPVKTRCKIQIQYIYTYTMLNILLLILSYSQYFVDLHCPFIHYDIYFSI